MEDKINKSILEFNMINEGDSIAVGISGGADSVSLLYYLWKISKIKKIKLYPVHINHCIRGEEADRDEDFVITFCRNLGLNVIVNKIDVVGLSKKLGVGLEECGRKVRYECFNDLSDKYGAKIATAHTLSDSIETVLINLSMGSGLKGLCGIPPVRGNIIRPLICVNRDEVEEYCRKNNLKYINDSSNFTDEYTRNKVRHNIIPVLSNINPSFGNAVLRTVISLSEDNKYLSEIAEDKYNNCKIHGGYNSDYIRNLPICIRNRVLMKILRRISGGRIESSHVNLTAEIVKLGKGCVNIPGNHLISVDKGILKEKKINISSDLWEYKFRDINRLTEQGKTFIIRVFSIDEYNEFLHASNNRPIAQLDMELIPKESLIRNRRQGDVFSPEGRNLTKSVKKLFNELKIPIENRDSISMLAYKNEIIWIEGVGVSEKYKVNNKTEKIAVILKGS